MFVEKQEWNLLLKRTKEGEIDLIMGAKLTGYPSKDRLHYRGTTFAERHPFIPGVSISNAIDYLNVFRQDEFCERLL